jgi:hypothetical protein
MNRPFSRIKLGRLDVRFSCGGQSNAEALSSSPNHHRPPMLHTYLSQRFNSQVELVFLIEIFIVFLCPPDEQ